MGRGAPANSRCDALRRFVQSHGQNSHHLLAYLLHNESRRSLLIFSARQKHTVRQCEGRHPGLPRHNVCGARPPVREGVLLRASIGAARLQWWWELLCQIHGFSELFMTRQ